MSNLMPVVFMGHGNPMNAISQNVFTECWASFGKSVPNPSAIVAISAHWYVPGTAVTVNSRPRTIHDFGGFPPELYQVQYPAPGDPELARRLQTLLAPVKVEQDESWGLDHGTWSVLCHVFPKADIPVVQLSIDETQPPKFHFEIGKRLAPLREDGILFLGSGNVVHNLGRYAWGKAGADPFDWAARFENLVRESLLNGDHAKLVGYKTLGRDAQLSVPTPDHYLPLLYILGLSQEREATHILVDGIEGGSISMLAVQLG